MNIGYFYCNWTKKMIDFHNHILPAVDDGSSSLNMSLEMLKKAHLEGTKTVVNTTHFKHPKMKHINTEFNHLNKIKNNLIDGLKKNNIEINIILCSEIYYNEDIIEDLQNDFHHIGHRYYLVEFDPKILPISYEEKFFATQMNNLTPIIAHVERYRNVQKNINLVKKWIDMGYIIQINCSSIIGDYGPDIQKTAFKLIDKGLCHIIGSDAHDNLNRNFCLKSALSIIRKKNGNDNKKLIIDNVNKLVNGLNLKQTEPRKKNFSFFNF